MKQIMNWPRKKKNLLKLMTKSNLLMKKSKKPKKLLINPRQTMRLLKLLLKLLRMKSNKPR
jgi:hypothetical protein